MARAERAIAMATRVADKGQQRGQRGQWQQQQGWWVTKRAMATKWAMATATRVVGNKESKGKGSKGNGNGNKGVG